ncbi:hypothetical protein DHX103_03540 [Planococcus sp. X10-3]
MIKILRSINFAVGFFAFRPRKAAICLLVLGFERRMVENKAPFR